MNDLSGARRSWLAWNHFDNSRRRWKKKKISPVWLDLPFGRKLSDTIGQIWSELESVRQIKTSCTKIPRVNLFQRVNLFRGDKNNPSCISSSISHRAKAFEAVAVSGCTSYSCCSQLHVSFPNVFVLHFFLSSNAMSLKLFRLRFWSTSEPTVCEVPNKVFLHIS